LSYSLGRRGSGPPADTIQSSTIVRAEPAIR
jgi:hypothetical protein